MISKMSSAPASEAPPVAATEAASLCDRLFFRPMKVDALEGYQDANFRVEDAAGQRFVLKVSRGGGDPLPIRLERRVLSHLAELCWAGVPRLVASRRGRLIERVDRLDGLDVRLLSWLEGVPLARLGRCPPGLLIDLGRYLGRLDDALAAIDLRQERLLEWDLAQLATQRHHSRLIEESGDRRLVETAIDGFLERREALLPRLRRGLIHGDANDHNVIVSSGEEAPAGLVGLIDFGDLVVTESVYELAVAACYVGLTAEDPWSAAQPLIGGYDEIRSLNEAELEILLPAIRARLALSVSMAARRRDRGTADPYALVSEQGAWATLRRLAGLSSSEALATLGVTLRRDGAR